MTEMPGSGNLVRGWKIAYKKVTNSICFKVFNMH